MEEKKCTKCHTVKKTDEFYRAGGSRKGWAAECKQCYKLRKRKTTRKKLKSSISEDVLNELDNNYIGLKIKCKVCNNIKPSYRYHYIKEKFHKACNSCIPNIRYKIPLLKDYSNDGYVINLEELKFREDIYLGVKQNNDELLKLNNYLQAGELLKLISRRRGLLEIEELMMLINLSLNIYDKIPDTSDTHTDFVNMYNNILHFYRNYEINKK